MKHVYMLRTCNSDGKGHGGFQWPKKGIVRCDDWNPKPMCGGGLHGLLWGEGSHGYLSYKEDALWQVVRVLSSDVVYITEHGGGKWKYPKGVVVYTGTRDEALEVLKKNTPDSMLDRIYGGNNTTGIQGNASASGIQGNASASGYKGNASASGDYGNASASGIQGNASASGYKGNASASGREGTALSYHIASAGENGTIIIKWLDEKAQRFRVKVGYVGEDSIKPNTKYILNEKHEFEELK